MNRPLSRVITCGVDRIRSKRTLVGVPLTLLLIKNDHECDSLTHLYLHDKVGRRRVAKERGSVETQYVASLHDDRNIGGIQGFDEILHHSPQGFRMTDIRCPVGAIHELPLPITNVWGTNRWFGGVPYVIIRLDRMIQL